MRTMLLIFKADVYKKNLTGEKTYGHRNVFPDKAIKAYLYISTPIKSIVGVMHLNNRVKIESWKEKYAYDENILQRIDAYLQHHKYAMEIADFQDTNRILLEQMRNDLPDFVVPQMYYFIDNMPLLDYLEQNLIHIGEKIIQDFSHITSEQVYKEIRSLV